MKNSLKRKLSLLLAIALVFTMALPTGLLASAADGDDPVVPVAPTDAAALEEDVTDKVDTTTVTSTTAGLAGETAENIFSSALDTKYCGFVSPTDAAPLDFVWQMTEAVAVQTYAITSANDTEEWSGRDPKNWKLYGSNDGEEWVELDSRVGQGIDSNSATLLYTFDNTEAYSYYKYSVTANRGVNIVQIACLQLSTKKYESDADTAAWAAAAAFDEKLEALGELTAETYKGQDTIEAVAALRAEYKALSASAQSKVSKLSILNAAEAYIAQVGAKDKVAALIAEIKATYEEYGDEAFVGTFDYHLNGKITHAMDLYNSLSEADQADIADYAILEEVRQFMDEEENEYFDVTVVGWDQPAKATKTPWIASATEEEQSLSQDAATDELKYQYSRQGYMLSNYAGATLTLTAGWGEAMIVQLEAVPNDNVFNPWAMEDRYWASVCVPFAGTAFSLTGYFALVDNVTPLSNAFYMDGKVYQQYMGMYRYYDYQEIGLLTETNVAPVVTNVASYPGYDGSSDITKNTFRRAYAEYNQANKWNDTTLGIPATEAALLGDNIIYQAFAGPQGTAYIVASASAIESVDETAPSASAFVLDKDMIETIAALDTENGNFLAGLEITGAPLTAVEDGIQLFENGVFKDGAFAAKSAETEYLYVIVDINNLPTAITASNYASAKAAIEAARAAYDALTANKDQVNTAILETAESALSTYETNVNAANAVTEMIDALPADLTVEDEETVKAARAAYDALTPEQRALVKGLNILVFCESEIDALKAEAVEDLLNEMPADEDITSETLAETRVPVETAKAAYDKLTDDQKSLVDSALVRAMNYKLEIIEAGGIDKFIKKGDVDRDGQITVSDVVELRKLIVAGEKDSIGDMDGDGLLTVSDVVELRAVIVAG